MFPLSVWARALSLAIPLAAGFAFSSAVPLHAQTNPLGQSSVAAEVGDLKLQLEKGLRARRPVEFEFVELVVQMVANETLPLDLVKSTFLWARKKALTTPYPFPYFETALRVRAAKQGIAIPKLGS